MYLHLYKSILCEYISFTFGRGSLLSIIEKQSFSLHVKKMTATSVELHDFRGLYIYNKIGGIESGSVCSGGLMGRISGLRLRKGYFCKSQNSDHCRPVA